MSNNFNEKLKKSFQGGSEAKAATAAISSRIKAAVRIGLFALPILWFIGFVSAPNQNDLADSIVKKEDGGVKDTPQKGQQGSSGQGDLVQKGTSGGTRHGNQGYEIPVQTHITIPAYGIYTEPMLKFCKVDNISKELNGKVKRLPTNNNLATWKSNHSQPINATVWYYNWGEGGCLDEYYRLVNLGLIPR